MILVTGATGNVGRELVEILAAQGESLRLVTRDKSKIAHMPANVEIVEGDIGLEPTVNQAMLGVDALFLFPVIFDLTHQSTKLLVDAARANGVRRIVMLSSMAAAYDVSELGRLHREKEVLIEQSKIPCTFVRPTGFMSNVLQWMPTIQSMGKIFSATGDGRVALISPHDIAVVAAQSLVDFSSDNRIYSLTGPELLNASQQVQILSKALGIELEKVEVPAEKIAEQMAAKGLPPFLIDSMVKMWARIKSGGTELQTDDLRDLTGSRGEPFAQWCEKHRREFLINSPAGGRI
jgi:(4-alkanoyl-5-oxo-2,5-dihydrofuran-3-yl)methyl phosphate reductase